MTFLQISDRIMKMTPEAAQAILCIVANENEELVTEVLDRAHNAVRKAEAARLDSGGPG